MDITKGLPMVLKKVDFLQKEPIFQNIWTSKYVFNPDITLSDLHQHQFIEIAYACGI